MSAQILQLNFKLDVPREDYEEAVWPLAADFAEVPGLVWKIWLLNEAASEAGGLYLFEDGASLTAFLDSPLAAAVKSHPALSELSAKPFDVMCELTSITRGPVATARVP